MNTALASGQRSATRTGIGSWRQHRRSSTRRARPSPGAVRIQPRDRGRRLRPRRCSAGTVGTSPGAGLFTDLDGWLTGNLADLVTFGHRLPEPAIDAFLRGGAVGGADLQVVVHGGAVEHPAVLGDDDTGPGPVVVLAG